MKRWSLLIFGQRGNVLALTILMLSVMLAFSGVAVDIGRAMSAKTELQRAIDAGALAGAGTMSPGDSTTYSTAGNAAVTFASNNPYSGGTPSLTWNADNSGTVKVGVWNGSWSPSLVPVGGFLPNAVRCQWSATIPTTFLGIIGMPTLTVTAASLAYKGPPATCLNDDGTPCAVAPFALPDCSFISGGTAGCGTMISTIQGGSGAAVWAELYNSGGGASAVRTELEAAMNNQSTTTTLNAGQNVSVINGAVTSAYDLLASFSNSGGSWHWETTSGNSLFIQKFNATVSSPVTVKQYVNGQPGSTVYEGPGWTIVVPIISSASLPCSGSSGGGAMPIETFSYLTVVQVINQGYCAVNNPGYQGAAPWNSLCAVPPSPGPANGASSSTPRDPNLRAVFGYYNCKTMNSTTAAMSAPLTAFATRPRLGQ
jgi:Putative Flp pilus-assembly TadE/G-like